MRSLVLTAVIIAILILAGFAALFVLDVVPREDLRDAFGKTVLVYIIAMVASAGVWGVLRISKQS